MRIYADLPARRTAQVVFDLLAIAWTTLGIWAAITLRGLVLLLAEPGAVLESAGRDLNRRVLDAADAVEEVPLAGEQLRRPLDVIAEAGLDIAGAGTRQQDVVHDLAVALTTVVVVVTLAVALVGWLPWRVRWIRQARAAERLLAGTADASLFALRALTNRSLRQLHRVHPDPAAAWRAGDPEALRRLATLELAALGLRAPTPPR